MTILYIIFAILGIGLIIFIHEAGHFLAAKKVGVRVERFALGFDPVIRGRRLRFFSFQRGETEYVLGMIPFGGYVKMAGEMLPDPDSEHRPAEDELLAKSVGARALVFVAGAVMNILSAFVFFMVAFTVGVPFTEAKLGSVTPGGSAWEAGLRPGDDVLEINGRPTVDFSELILSSALGSAEEVIHLKVERRLSGSDGGAGGEPDGPATRILDVEVSPRRNQERGLYQIGVGPALSPVLERDPPGDTPAYRAGLRRGDRVVGAKIGGVNLPPLVPAALLRAILDSRLLRNEPVGIRIRRDGRDQWVTLEPRPDPESERVPQVGIVAPESSGTVVRALFPGSSADEIFDPGDRVLSVNDRPVGSLHWLSIIGEFPTEALEIVIESASGDLRTVRAPRRDILLWDLSDEILWGGHGVLIGSLAESSPLAGAGLLAGDLITKVGEERVSSRTRIENLLGKAEAVELTFLRDGEKRSITFTREDTTQPLGVRWSSFPSIAFVVKGGPADTAGISPGSRILSFRDEPIHDFVAFQNALQELGEDLDRSFPIEWIDARGRKKEGQVRVGMPVYRSFGFAESLSYETETVKAGVLASFGLGVRRTIHIGKQVFLMLRSLVSQRVSARHLSGPLGITHVFTEAARSGLGKLLYFMAMVSVNLGLLNLLPFPILDGGHLLFLLVEKIKGSPVSVRVQELATTVAFFLIITLFLFVTFHDVRRVLFW